MKILRKVSNRVIVCMLGFLALTSLTFARIITRFCPTRISLPIIGFMAKSFYYIGLTGMRVMYFLHPTEQAKAEIDNMVENMRIIDTLDMNEIVEAMDEGKVGDDTL